MVPIRGSSTEYQPMTNILHCGKRQFRGQYQRGTNWVPKLSSLTLSSLLTLNSTVTETYTTALPGLLGPGCCNLLPIWNCMHLFFCKTNIIGWWSPYSNVSNILIWVSLGFSQPWALEIHYIEKKRLLFEKNLRGNMHDIFSALIWSLFELGIYLFPCNDWKNCYLAQRWNRTFIRNTT